MQGSQTPSKCAPGILVIANVISLTVANAEVMCSMLAVQCTQSCSVFLKRKCNDSQMEILAFKALIFTL